MTVHDETEDAFGFGATRGAARDAARDSTKERIRQIRPATPPEPPEDGLGRVDQVAASAGFVSREAPERDRTGSGTQGREAPARESAGPEHQRREVQGREAPGQPTQSRPGEYRDAPAEPVYTGYRSSRQRRPEPRMALNMRAPVSLGEAFQRFCDENRYSYPEALEEIMRRAGLPVR